MKNLVKMIITKLTGNRFAQYLLEKNIRLALYLSGVGSGGGVQNSGEKAVFNFINSVGEPLCVFDVGANKGQYLNLLLDEFSKKNFTIHSFEPGKYTYDLLQKKYGDSAHVKLNNLGLGEIEGEYLLYYDEQGSGLASISKRKLDHIDISFDKSEKIQIITLDNYCLQNKIIHIHLLKIDVEGHEMDVLKGATNMFTSRSIDAVTFEFGGCNIDTRTFFQDFYYFFNHMGMTLFRITPSGYLFPIGKYREQYEQFTTTNFVALLKSTK